jgi:hypothetical protein
VLIDIVAIRDRKVILARRNDFRARAHLVEAGTSARVLYVLAPVENAPRFDVQPPLVWLDEAISALLHALETSDRAKPAGIVPNAPEIFVAMPFDTRFSDVYNVAIRGAAKALKVGTFRADYQGSWGDVVQDIKLRIDRCLFMVGDVSGSRPNVLYELGFGHALGRKSVLIREEDDSRAPFDISHERIHSYRINDTIALQRFLRRAFREELRARGLIPPDRRRRRAA